MGMFRHVAQFEFGYQLRRPVFWICFALFFVLTFAAITSDAVTIGGSIGQVNRNAPFVILQIMLVMSSLGVLVMTAFVADAVQRDSELKTEGLFYSTRITRKDYLLGRFLGAFGAGLLIYVGIAAAIWIGSQMPWLEADRIGPTLLAPYLSAMALLVIPSAFLQGCVFFGLATATRSLKWTYVGVIGFLACYVVSQAVLGDIDNESLAALLDPFGFGAFTTATKYWTVADRNSASLPLSHDLLLNRALWIGVGLIALGVTYWRFNFRTEAKPSRWRRKRAPEAPAHGLVATGLVPTGLVPTGLVPTGAPLVLPRATRNFGFVSALGQLLHQAWIEVRALVFSAPFLVIVGFGVFNLVGSSGSLDSRGFGGEIYPVTQVMLRIIDGAYLFLVILLTTFFAGEVVFRERQAAFDGIRDSLPVPGWVLWGGKLAALVAALGVMLTAAIVAGVSIQAWRGYTTFELPLYVQWTFLKTGIPFLMVAVLAMTLQVLANNRFIGYFGMLLYLISSAALAALHYQHNLYQFAGAPGMAYSDMNGFGHFKEPLFWFYLYWGFFSVGLLVALHLLWVRGADGDWRSRLRIARQRLTPATVSVSLAALVGFVATGGFIYYNTNVLNTYEPNDVRWDRQAEFEKNYAQYRHLPQPRITAVQAEVDIWPAERTVDIRGTYTLRNKTAAPIERVHLWLNPEVTASELTLPGSAVEQDDPTHGYSIRKLASPLQPGAELELAYTIRIENPGFVNHNSNVRVVENGTFFDSSHYFPHIGYQRDGELQDPNERRKRDFEPVQRMAKLEDQAARRNNALSAEADWVRFETTVSTAVDQIAMAPGYLQREWTEGERRYFHYRMDAPILAFWAYVSARYQVARDTWRDEVPIEVYYHGGHDYNVVRMIDSVKQSLDYFTANFSPYQHRQVRILEFPGYRTFAQSFPNTIPYSESIGFISRIHDEPDPEEVDYVNYVTAHEIAHQWWAHQVIGGDVQGSTLLAETLSQYSALMVMEQEYGEEHMRKFLKQELDRYLRQRGGERIEELPLMRVENQQYLHYNKGSVVMYALKDAIGAEAVNRALANFIAKKAMQEPPYTTTAELLEELRAVTPEDKQGLITDLFEYITLYDNGVKQATVVERADGKFEVTLDIASVKLRADGLGVETPVPLDDWIDVAVFGAKGAGDPADGKLLKIEKVHVQPDTSQVQLVVDERPHKAGFDPFNKLVDRNPDDNVVRVE